MSLEYRLFPTRWWYSTTSLRTQILGIFIVQGAVTIVVALLGWFVIIDFPSRANKFLTPREQAYVLARINQDRGDAEEDAVTRAKILHHLGDWKLYFWAFNLLASAVPGYALVFFMPIILRDGMGFSTADSMLLMAPPSGSALILALAAAWAGDRYKIRGPIVAFCQLMSAVGLLVLVYSTSNGAKLFGGFWCTSPLRCPSITNSFADPFGLLKQKSHRLQFHHLYSPWNSYLPGQQHHLAFQARRVIGDVLDRRRYWRYYCQRCLCFQGKPKVFGK